MRFVLFMNEKYDWEIWDLQKGKSYVLEEDEDVWVEVIEDWSVHACVHELNAELERLGLPLFEKIRKINDGGV